MSGTERKAIVLGITGGIACGKSEVGRILEERGFAVLDSDTVAHDLMKEGTPIYQKVLDHFGKDILADTGEISRAALGKIVFEDATERSTLNQLVHPAVREQLVQWIAGQRQKGNRAAALIPLLFESRMEALNWDAVVCVSSSDSLVIERLQQRGLKLEDAERRMQSQMPLVEKEQRSDYVVSNHGTIEQLEHFTRETVMKIMAER